MEMVLVNAEGTARRVKHGDRWYWLAPITSIVPGVLNGSQGALLYTSERFSRNVKTWDGMPLTMFHPTDELNNNVSARHPKILAKHGLGHVYNSTWNGKLTHVGWFDEEMVKAADKRFGTDVLNRLESGQPIEMSTGLYTDVQRSEPGATHNGREYTHEVVGFHPDHIAVLPHGQGACSLADGCGVNVNEDSGKCPECGGDMKDGVCDTCGYREQPNEHTANEAAGAEQTSPAKVHGDKQLKAVLKKAKKNDVAKGAMMGDCPTENELADLEVWLTYNRDWPQAKRDKLDPKSFAGPGQSFPISTQTDLDAAIHSIGRAKDPATVKAGIRRIAKAKGLKLPDTPTWNDDEIEEGDVTDNVGWTDEAREAAALARQAHARAADNGKRNPNPKTSEALSKSAAAQRATLSADSKEGHAAAQKAHEAAATFHSSQGMSRSAGMHQQAAAIHGKLATNEERRSIWNKLGAMLGLNSKSNGGGGTDVDRLRPAGKGVEADEPDDHAADAIEEGADDMEGGGAGGKKVSSAMSTTNIDRFLPTENVGWTDEARAAALASRQAHAATLSATSKGDKDVRHVSGLAKHFAHNPLQSKTDNPIIGHTQAKSNHEKAAAWHEAMGKGGSISHSRAAELHRAAASAHERAYNAPTKNESTSPLTEVSMNRELCINCLCKGGTFNEDDRETLNGYDDAKLKRLVAGDRTLSAALNGVVVNGRKMALTINGQGALVANDKAEGSNADVTGSNTRKLGIDAGRDDNDSGDGADPAKDEVDYTDSSGEARKMPPKGGSATMNQLLKNATQEDRDAWENALAVNAEHKRQIVQRLVSNVTNPQRRQELALSLNKKPLSELKVMLELAGNQPVQNQQFIPQPDPVEVFLGNGGGPIQAPQLYTGNADQSDVLDLPEQGPDFWKGVVNEQRNNGRAATA